MVTINSTSGPVSISSEEWLLKESGYEDLYMTSRDGLKLHNYLIKNQTLISGLLQYMAIHLKEN